MRLREEINPAMLALERKLKDAEKKLYIAEKELAFLRAESARVSDMSVDNPLFVDGIANSITLPLLGEVDVTETSPYEYSVKAYCRQKETGKVLHAGFYMKTSDWPLNKEKQAEILMFMLQDVALSLAGDL